MTNNGGIQQKLNQGGALQKYRSTVTGSQGISQFLLYEFSATVISLLPGRFGVHVRRLYLPLLFDCFGCNVTMKQNITLRRPHRISIGNRVVLENGVTLDVKTDAGYIEIQDDVHINRHTIISCPGGTVVIRSGVRIGSRCRLGSLQGLKIGANAMIDDYVCLVGAGHAYSATDTPIIRQPLTCKGETAIGDCVEIEKGVTVLDGIHIGNNAKIVHNSLVNKDIAAEATVAGVPQQIVKDSLNPLT